jgi:adenosylhomocysteine nucleosidase
MKRIGIIAALAGELKPLVQGWERRDLPRGASYSQQRNGLETFAVYCGMGRESAARACMYAMEGGPLTAIVSIGWAGALSSGIRTGHSFCVTDVVDAATGERYVTEDAGREQTHLVTARRVLLKREKRQFAEDFGAMLVDMEAATVARLARTREIPFYCYKAVTDSSDELLPDMNPYISRDGQMAMGRFVASVLVKPQYWPGLMRMGKNGSRGAIALAEAVSRLRREMEDAHGS